MDKDIPRTNEIMHGPKTIFSIQYEETKEKESEINTNHVNALQMNDNTSFYTTNQILQVIRIINKLAKTKQIYNIGKV